MKIFLLSLLTMAAVSLLPAQESSPTGIFSASTDVGQPALAGSTQYDANTQTYTLKGAGYNIWFERDEFHYAYQELEGDFILTAEFAFEGKGLDPHRKVGWMVRGSDADNAAHISAVNHGDGLTVLQWRELRGAFMRDPEDEIFAPKAGYQIIQLERKGSEYFMRAAHPGEPLQLIGSHRMESMSGKVLAGLFVCSHNPEVVETAQAWNVRIDQPLRDDNYNPYQSGFIMGCRLETMDVFSRKRTIIYEQDTRLEAPNWMPEGDKLLFNMEGSLYTIPVTGGKYTQLNTGDVRRNNNDHGISFDGKSLAISSHRDGLAGGGSSVYVLPLKGGTPKLVTERTPSYWHGWSPNNKEVVYVAQREGSDQYDIYSNTLKGDKETQLTHNGPGEHADGCEFSPDGQYIYYNGNHTGTMQIWRMKPDGSDPEQMTFDEYNDWFPHLSPDGKWMVFISFDTSVAPNDHPSYKRVTLRMMPANGGPVQVLAYLYGGQGTINVPSWSPDSKRIAFVSNSVPRKE